ncbi:hypothetical protein NE237_003219 [Protea cynaroides]|uniref:Transmembrane protein n=1 Tax=Protea cynaroides TaxID=273540 RepID=A0A9Q0QS84_9MAGN|nr:hypothetical protein NE237_003219 [Protea cynaroides]
MRPLSSLGIGLILVFGCLLLALVAELYYLLWWKKRVTNREIEDDYNTPARELFYAFCWKKPPLLSSTALNPQELCTSVRITGAHGHETENQLNLSGSNKDLLLKPFGGDSMESELLMLQNLCGPPRFLFTIKEETKEDLESEDGKSRGDRSRRGSRNKSLSDILMTTVETPFLTPMPSPPFFTPPLTPMDSYNHHGLNPLYESSTEAEMNRIRSSPPPKFKFLKDAEEKLYRRKLMEEAEKKIHENSGSVQDVVKASPVPSLVADEEDPSFITIIVGKNKEKELHHHSSSSQVLPLSCSPSTIQPDYKKPISHSSPIPR